MGGRLHQPKARDEIGRSVRFYAALGLVTAATLMLQIIETRIISVTSWYHLAFFVISIAMFGLTAGAVFVYLRKDMFKPERLSYDLAVATLAFALSTDLAILAQLTLVTGASPSLISLVAWAEFALFLALPFFFSGDRRPSRIRCARWQAVSPPPQHPRRVPAFCVCQHAHDLWRSTASAIAAIGSDDSGWPASRKFRGVPVGSGA